MINGLLHPDMVLIGEGSPEIGARLETIYKASTQNTPAIHRMAPESAEITKLAVNCFVTMKISYANMIGDIADRTPGADKNEVLGAVGKDSRVGSKYLRPGYGFGGPCFPRDNRALGGYAKSIGVQPLLPIATDDYNKMHTQVRLAPASLRAPVRVGVDRLCCRSTKSPNSSRRTSRRTSSRASRTRRTVRYQSSRSRRSSLSPRR